MTKKNHKCYKNGSIVKEITVELEDDCIKKLNELGVKTCEDISRLVNKLISDSFK